MTATEPKTSEEDTIIFSKGSWYTKLYGRYYRVTKIFMNYKDPKQNIKDANTHMESARRREAVLKSRSGDRVIILARVTDVGVDKI